jgi:uncharacterized protein YbjT (DUF2867 family)
MSKVLITGATGNVGVEVIKALHSIEHKLEICAGVRKLQEGKKHLNDYNVSYSLFDFTDVGTYKTALNECDILFLLRPPQISAVEKYFKPIMDTCKDCGVKHIIFLSVQGVEQSKIIPHHKIEKLIVESNIPYTFLRPAYFMQNFTTTLQQDLVQHKRIYLPAGKAKFALIDVRDIGAVAAAILTNLPGHINKAYELTCNENLTFSEMARIWSENSGADIRYVSPNLFSFFLTKRKEKMPFNFILVMIMLHYLPRFQKEPATTQWISKIIQRDPLTFEHFVKDNIAVFDKVVEYD